MPKQPALRRNFNTTQQFKKVTKFNVTQQVSNTQHLINLIKYKERSLLKLYSQLDDQESVIGLMEHFLQHNKLMEEYKSFVRNQHSEARRKELYLVKRKSKDE